MFKAPWKLMCALNIYLAVKKISWDYF